MFILQFINDVLCNHLCVMYDSDLSQHQLSNYNLIHQGNLHKRYSHVVRELYKPPKLNNNDLSISTFIDEFAPILSTLGNKNRKPITGDFNIDLLKVNDRLKVGDYFDLFCTNGFDPKITLPARFSRDNCTLRPY